MTYHISRNGQVFGPYTLEDIHRYLAAGSILLTDLARSEDMPQWIPVAQLIAASPTVPARQYAAAWPAPPNLHWGLLTLIDIFTCSIFSMVWNLILAAWFEKINPHRRVLLYYAIATVLMLIEGAMSSHHRLTSGDPYAVATYWVSHASTGLFGLAVWIFRIYTRFNFRAALEEHYNTVKPMGLRLNGVLTFFFGGIYFQYKLNEINDAKQAFAYTGAPPR